MNGELVIALSKPDFESLNWDGRQVGKAVREGHTQQEGEDELNAGLDDSEFVQGLDEAADGHWPADSPGGRLEGRTEP